MQLKPWSRVVDYTTPTGVKVKLYNIAVVADAIGRTSQTIRKWEVSGVIPPTPFKDSNGCRLYTSAQISSIVKSAERSRLKQGKPMKNLKFSDRVYKDFEVLNAHYLTKINPKLDMEEQ